LSSSIFNDFGAIRSSRTTDKHLTHSWRQNSFIWNTEHL